MDDLDTALNTYRMSILFEREPRYIMERVLKLVPSHARMFGELRDSRCTGFCRLIQFSNEANDRVKQLIFRMVMASLGSYHRNGVRSRAIGVISGNPALIVTDGYVGVCCSSLK